MRHKNKNIFEKIWTSMAIIIISGLTGKANVATLFDDEQKE
ncbi:MAG: hypothetical protein ACYDAJ_00275 [Nitrosotalea sp.]